MTKTLIKFVFLLAILLVGYNFFLGTPQEKESSRRVVGQVGELSSSVFDLLKSEKEKFDGGKYDAALGKLKSAIGLEKEQASQSHHECVEECDHLQEKEQAIESKLRDLASTVGISEEERESRYRSIREEILQLTREIESLSRELE